MSEHINKREDIWNERVNQKIGELYGSQRKFIEKYRKEYGTGSQADVSKWVNVGELYVRGRNSIKRKFPEFATMQKIANILGVSVGYLIGETDYETFELEKICNYTGLDSAAITGICNITSGKAIPPFYKYPDYEINSALDIMLSTPFIVEYLRNICELAKSIDLKNKRNPKEHYEKEIEKIPKRLRDDVVALWADPEDAIDNHGVDATEEKWKYVKQLDNAACDDLAEPEESERRVKASKYALNEAHTQLVNDIMTANNIERLLSAHTTKEEVERSIGKH